MRYWWWSQLENPLAMVNVSFRNIQAMNVMFSSWALVFMAIGVLTEEWVELTLETKENTIRHSPWICCTTLWPEGQKDTMERDGGRGRVPFSLISTSLTSLLSVLWGNFRGLPCTQFHNQWSRLTPKSHHFAYFGEKFRSA